MSRREHETRIEKFLREYGFPANESVEPPRRQSSLFPDGWDHSRPPTSTRTTPKRARREVRRTWYFAYGSNLNPLQMERRCPGSFIQGPGTLEGHRLAFAGWSRGWDGPVATLVSSGESCQGLVYSITEEDLALLDQFEAYPSVYQRERHDVLMEDGSVLRCWVYFHTGTEAMARPSPQYLGVIEKAYRDYDFDLSVLPSLAHERIFVYGTLRQDQKNHRVLTRIEARYVGRACTIPAYTMVNCGEYPAVIAGGRTAIQGEVYDLPMASIQALDDFEGVPNLYSRSRVKLTCGAELTAYLMHDWQVRHLPRINTGDWTRPLAPASRRKR